MTSEDVRPALRPSPRCPRAVLASVLREMAPNSSAAVEIADRAGPDLRRQVFRARAGKPIHAGAFLALCGAVGIDPASGTVRPSKKVPPEIMWPMVGTGLKIVRRLRYLDQRAAAQIVGASAATICRVEGGVAVSVESFLAICRFMGVHPDHGKRAVKHEAVDFKSKRQRRSRRSEPTAPVKHKLREIFAYDGRTYIRRFVLNEKTRSAKAFGANGKVLGKDRGFKAAARAISKTHMAAKRKAGAASSRMSTNLEASGGAPAQ
jgi:hypothetical protein